MKLDLRSFATQRVSNTVLRPQLNISELNAGQYFCRWGQAQTLRTAKGSVPGPYTSTLRAWPWHKAWLRSEQK